MRADITDCLNTLCEYNEKDFGIDRSMIDADENPYRNLLEHLIVSSDYVDELIDWIDYGAPDQR